MSITQRLDKKTIYGWTLTGLAERLIPYRDFKGIRMFIGSMDNTEYGDDGAMGC